MGVFAYDEFHVLLDVFGIGEEGADINLDYHRAPKGAYSCIQNVNGK